MKKKFLGLLMTLIIVVSTCFITVFATDTAIPSLTVAGASLSLKNAVYINFKVAAENMEVENIKLLVWDTLPEEYKKDTETACLDYLGTDSDGYAVFQYDDLTAKDMTKMVYACAYTVMDGVEYYSEPVKYSILTYAYNMKDTTEANLKNLLDGMLQYGALAQVYFNYNTDFLATDAVYKITVNNGTLEDGFTHGLYQEGKVATLTANEAEEGYVFSHWENSVGETIGEESTLSVTVSREETYTAVYDEIPKELDFTLSEDGTYYIVSGIGTCEDTDVVIPPTHEGLPVKEIGMDAFLYCSKLTSITIPNTIIHIGSFAFQNCSGLTSIIIPDSITSIDFQVFRNCENLESVKLSNNIKTISNYTFYNCISLKNIDIPDSVTSVGIGAFYGCSSLTNIVIPNSVTSIGNSAFYNCKALTNVTMSENVTNIGTSTFYGCSNLLNINIPNTVTNIGEMAFYQCSKIENLLIPDLITSINRYTFGWCNSFTHISIPKNVTTINDLAFAHCHKLESIILPCNLKSIGGGAFNACSALTSVFYEGTTDEWNTITISSSANQYFISATIYYYSEFSPTADGNYWHYVDGVPTPW